MTFTLSPSPWFTGLDDNGVTLPGAKLFTYASGTTTKLTTYTDAAGNSANANPTILDAAGRAVMYLQPATYKFVLAPANDTDPPTSPIKTIDPVEPVPNVEEDLSVSGTAGENISTGECCYLSIGTVGTAGKWFLTTESVVNQSAAAIGFALEDVASGSVGLFRMAGLAGPLQGGLIAGTTYYVGPGDSPSDPPGGITATPGANPWIVGVADSVGSLLMAEKRVNEVVRVASWQSPVSTVGAGEDILATYSPTATLYKNGMGWEGRFWGDSVNNANAKQLRLRLIEGANNNLICNFPLTAAVAGAWDVSFTIIRTSTTTFTSVATVINGADTGPISRGGNNVLTGSTLTFANTVELRLTGEATTDGDIRMMGGIVKRINFGQ